LKTKIRNFGADCWQMLTEVPGWPDAPPLVRLRRVLPLLVPCIAMVLVLAWNMSVRDPEHRRELRSRHALEVQDKEIEALRLVCSEQEAGELAARAAQVGRLCLNAAAELGPVLQGLKQAAASQQWDASFQAAELAAAAPVPEDPVVFLPVRAKLSAMAGNPQPFPTLLALFEQFSTSEKRIDLTRVGIRADEQGRYTVELNLRLVSRSPHEKITQ